jgi:hypothetical protein
VKEETPLKRAERKREGTAEKLVEASNCFHHGSYGGATESMF